jgi:hypothetical protein
MAHHTIRERERLTKLSEGQCDLNDVQAIVDRVVAVSVMALTGGAEVTKKAPRPAAPYGRLTRQDLYAGPCPHKSMGECFPDALWRNGR